MAASATPEQEPSIEEILGSIRRIIAEESDEETLQEHDAAVEKVMTDDETKEAIVTEGSIPTQGDRRKAPEAEAAAQDSVLDPSTLIDSEIDAPDQDGSEDDVLELTDLIEDDDSAAEPDPDLEPAQDALEDESLTATGADDAEPQIQPDANDEGDTALPDNHPDDDSLLTDAAAQAAGAALAKLSRHTPVTLTDGVTLEAIVRDLLKPLLKEWLNENLPAIVEKKVEEEVARLARK